MEEAEETDLPVYHFFSSLLDLSTTSAERIVEREERVEELNSLRRILDESLFEIAEYRARGISTPAEENLSHFISLERALRNIYDGQKLFLESFSTLQRDPSYELYLNALRGIEMGKGGIEEARLSISKIKTLEFRAYGGEVLRLRTEDIERALERLEKIFENYESLLQSYEFSERFIVIYASDENLHLFEEVEIYGYTSESEVTLHILSSSREEIVPVKVEGNRFSVTFLFEELGSYEVFATSGALKSNVIILNISKIPTLIVANGGSSKISEEFVVRGSLIDYTGNPLKNRKVLSGEMVALTDEKGSFGFRLKSEKRAEILLELVFPGDEIYESSTTSVRVIFYGEALKIVLEAPEGILSSGEIKFHGYVNSSYEIPLEIYVDGERKETLYASSHFTFNLSLNAGDHTIFALFRGDDFYEPSRSNILEIHVHAQETNKELLYLLLLLFAIISAKLIFSRRRAEIEEKREIRSDVIEQREVKRISESFRDLYLMLLKIYGLRRSMTPREVLRTLGDAQFRDELRRAVRLHERRFYGMERLKSPEERMLRRAIRKVIIMLRREL